MGPKDAVTANEMRLFDEWATNFIGIPGILLMENAGREVAEQVYNTFFTKKKSYDTVNIFCGTGNNGGDGMVVARHLLIKNVKVKVYIVGGVSSLSADSELNFRILRKMGMLVYPLLSEKDVAKVRYGKKDIIVDAIFGIGLNKEMGSVQRDMIESINASNLPVISVDIPSGLNANTGEDWGAAIHATRTITFVYPKRAFFTKKGKELTGNLVVTDIGIVKKKLQ